MSIVKKIFTLPDALLNRRTKRIFQNTALLTKIFYEGLKTAGIYLASAMDGFEFYLVIYNVKNTEPGVYQYCFTNNSLTLIQTGLFNAEMSHNTQGMRAHKTAAFTLIIAANFQILMPLMPYPRGLRDCYIEVGRIAQKILIAFMQYGVYCLVTPALRDREIVKLLKLNEPIQAPLYSLTFGYPLK